MRFFFDESGSFALPTNGQDHRVAVVAGVAVSDRTAEALAEGFRSFVAALKPEELHRGEPKGRLLLPSSRLSFCRLLQGYDGVQLTPVTLDLTSLFGKDVERLPKRHADLIRERASRSIHEPMRAELNLLASQFARLSPPQALRIYSWANCLRETLGHAITFLSSGGHEESWDRLRFEIDPVQVQERSREQLVFEKMVLSWLAGWSRTHPFMLVEDIHVPQHPFVRKYDTGSGIDIGRMLRGNIAWVRSSESWGLQISDLVASTVFMAANDLDDRNGSLSAYAELMLSSPYGPRRGPGLFTPLDGSPAEFERKYAPLSRAMANQPRRASGLSEYRIPGIPRQR